MTLSQEEKGPSNGNRDTASLLGDKAWSKRDQADEDEVSGVSTRRRKLTEKATLLKERREKINGGMMRKCSIIEDLLFSYKNRIAVEEEMAHLNELLMLLSIHEEYIQVLDDDERADEDEWFDDLNNTVCTSKRKIHSWLKQKGSHQMDSQEAVNQGETVHQEAQESLSVTMQGN